MPGYAQAIKLVGQRIEDIIPVLVKNPDDVLEAYHACKRIGEPQKHYYTLMDGTPGEAKFFKHYDRIYHLGWTYPGKPAPASIDVIIDDRIVHSYVPPGWEHCYVDPVSIKGLTVYDVVDRAQSDIDIVGRYEKSKKDRQTRYAQYTIGGLERWSRLIPSLNNNDKVFHISHACPPPLR